MKTKRHWQWDIKGTGTQQWRRESLFLDEQGKDTQGIAWFHEWEFIEKRKVENSFIDISIPEPELKVWEPTKKDRGFEYTILYTDEGYEASIRELEGGWDGAEERVVKKGDVYESRAIALRETKRWAALQHLRRIKVAMGDDGKTIGIRKYGKNAETFVLTVKDTQRMDILFETKKNAETAIKLMGEQIHDLLAPWN